MTTEPRDYDAATVRRSGCTRWPVSPNMPSFQPPMCFALPSGLPLLESSVLGCAVFTAYGAVRHGADLRGGERVAVVAAGGVGLNVVQIAHAFGASQIIAIDVRDDKLEIARRVGATDIINSRRPMQPSTFERSRTATGWTSHSKSSAVQRRLRKPWRSSAMVAGWSRSASHQARPQRPSKSPGWYAAAFGSSARTAPVPRADMPEIIRLAARGTFRPETIVTKRFRAGGSRRRLSGAGPRRNRRTGYRCSITTTEVPSASCLVLG